MDARRAHRVTRRHRHGQACAAASLALAALLAGCTGGAPPGDARRPGSEAAALKPPVQGLLDRHSFPRSGYTGAVRSFVVNTTWASLQPTQGGPIVRPNDIDRAIEQARTSGLTVKLRVRAGVDAPDWAKRIGGRPIPLYYTSSTRKHAGKPAGTIGRFWNPEYGAAYADLQAKLAALYDGVPEIRQTGVTRCGTIFTETYLRNTRNDKNTQALLGAGFSRAADDRCHDEQITAHLIWRRTRSGVAFNPYQAIQPDGSTNQDLAYTLAQMGYCRAVLGARCVLENYSLSSERLSDPEYLSIYAQMRKLGAPYDFQTATLDKIGDYEQVLGWAASSGASSVELPSGYQTWPTSALSSYAARLAANRTG